jgi:hypothetical protein
MPLHRLITQETVATAGYMSISDNKKWFNNFYIVKPFYQSNSQLLQAALKLQGAFQHYISE